MTRKSRTVHEADQHTFSIISRSVLLRRKSIADKSCRESQNTHFVFNNIFSSENRVVYEIMWQNMVEPERPQMAVLRMRIARWITGATDTHSEHVALYLFSTTTMVKRTRLNVTLHVVHCQSCSHHTIQIRTSSSSPDTRLSVVSFRKATKSYKHTPRFFPR